ncbi:MAG: TlyA family RNA methyltransferase [Hyphomicrobiaceae bacterium]
MRVADPNLPRQRFDQALVARGLVVSRARARDLILRGLVSIDGRIVTKPAMPVDAANLLAVADGAGDYVSRGALKLRAALKHFKVDPAGVVALDIGASTGGFTEVLLELGASRVYAVENGTNQLHERLRADNRVVSLERTDARRLDRQVVPEPIGAIVADVSFISLTKALPASLALAVAGSWSIALVKPQFEGEPGGVPRDGVVKDEQARTAAIERVAHFLEAAGWRVLGSMPSPIDGGDGNVEFLIGAVLDG